MNKFVVTILILFSFITISAQSMVSLDGGRFLMGSSTGAENEQPKHTVILSPFSIDVHEVTNQEYQECVSKGGCSQAHYSDGKCYIWSSEGLKKTTPPSFFKENQRPVVCISWQQATAYCRWKGKKLPTEAQWEYAATGGTKRYNISSVSHSTARYQSGSTAPVEQFPAGYNQLYDMCGNAWEWTRDRYEEQYYHYSPTKNPQGPVVGRFRTIRGGGWYSSLKQLSSRNRHWFAPEVGEVSIGFRCVKE